ncbi:MAG: hypothetical protein LBQ33_04725 [Oscillospiraceae bacterium]|nr:hypothetical protein [Oscillospiraceae bacterium]
MNKTRKAKAYLALLLVPLLLPAAGCAAREGAGGISAASTTASTTAAPSKAAIALDEAALQYAEDVMVALRWACFTTQRFALPLTEQGLWEFFRAMSVRDTLFAGRHAIRREGWECYVLSEYCISSEGLRSLAALIGYELGDDGGKIPGAVQGIRYEESGGYYIFTPEGFSFLGELILAEQSSQGSAHTLVWQTMTQAEGKPPEAADRWRMTVLAEDRASSALPYASETGFQLRALAMLSRGVYAE